MNNQLIDTLKDSLNGPLLQDNPDANVSKSERIISLGTGAFILFSGITNIFSHPLISLGKIMIGGSLLQRGLTGYCPLKSSIDDSFESPAPLPLNSPQAYPNS
ncbi:Protein of unknown function (DUF2892) [Arcticibacter pallidicorallinus]|uniref:Inner membrane protein YgaP-like transmembrane domain-containing protein n=1 Tax=Arcticibacter pallidicorallinus TaxID=1259464 RepID=A0A2T0U535_9SPHI|nr:DUF2892 domain-containing protein [Arcticibacter pallidicorallinus]PRY53033.1 Protein of unknown function (DUF2892) [Arcticibacter pallidicorallinus]